MTQRRAVRSIIAAVAVTASSCAANGPARAVSTSVASPHFRVEPLAEGVWAVFATPGGHLVSNAAIIDVGGATAVFDAGASLEAGRALRASAEALTGRPVRWLILSHGHIDNSRGAAAFDERTEVIAAEATSRLMDDEARDIANSRGEYPARAAKLRTEAASAPTPAERLELRLSAGLLEALAEPDVRLRLPDSHVVPRVLEGTRRKIVLDAHRGHTMGDVVALLPRDGIAFVGGLFFAHTHLWFADGDADALVASLEALRARGASRIVGAYGDVGSPADVTLAIDYVRALQDRARTSASRGETVEQDSARGVPDAYRSWNYPGFYVANLEFLHRIATAR